MEPVSLLIVIFAVIVMLRSFSRHGRKLRKLTKPWRRKGGYQQSRKAKFEIANKTKARNEASVKEQIESLPEAKVEGIIDGDTIIVAKGGHVIKIRLDSIDCPEDGQQWGDIAKYGLIKLIGGRTVRLEDHGLDCYGRTLATIYIQNGYGDGDEWINVNERMVTLGHAWVMHRFYDHLPKDRQDKLIRLERWARSKKVGLWKTRNPTSPWSWRTGG